MKIIALIACLFSTLSAQVYVTSGTATFAANSIQGSGTTTVTGPLIYGGIGTSPTLDWNGKIVLIDRGELSFFDKVSRVQNYGGLAAVISNNVTGLANTGALGTDNRTTIPAFAISQADGALLRAKVGSVATVGSAPVIPPVIVPSIPDPFGHKGDVLSSDGTKLVYAKPAMVGAEVGVTVAIGAGQKIVFSTSVLGTPPFSFQWTKDGATLPGVTTPSLVLFPVKILDAGIYVCQVTNLLGTAPSNVYTLNVTP